MIVVNSSTRQFTIPGADLVFGVTADSGSERKYFQCPRYVGDNLDIGGSFVRLNYRNANGEIDSYLVKDVAVDGNNVTFSWELSPKVTRYKGNVSFVMCVVGPDTKVAWHTTLGRGQVLEGLEPESALIEEGTADVVAALIAMVEAQTEAVKAEGATQVAVVKAAAKTAESDAVAEIEAKGVNVRESIPDDYTALSGAVRAIEKSMAPGIVCEVKGTAVTVSDASNQAMQGLRIFGKSTQDGSPTPDAPVEIVSVEKPVVSVYGKNYATVEGVVVQKYLPDATVVSDGNKITLHTKQYGDGFHFGLGTMKAGQTYVISGNAINHTNIRIYNINILDTDYLEIPVDGKGDFSVEYTPPTDNQTVRIWVGQEIECILTNFQICLKAVATTYEQPTKQIVSLTHTLPGIPVTSGGNYTDSDGQQWISDEVDLERGVYVRRIHCETFDGDESWSLDNGYSIGNRYHILLQNKCEMSDANNGVTSMNTNIEIGKSGGTADTPNRYTIIREGNMMYVSLTGTETLSEFKSYLSEHPMTLLAILSTPIETPLSETEIAAYRAMHTNYPNTTVLNDGGAHMVVKYAADTKLYIDNKIAALVGG